MPSLLDAQLRNVLFLVRDSAVTRKLSLPPDWQTALVTTQEQVVSATRRAHDSSQKLLVLVAEEDFTGTIELIRPFTKHERELIFGSIVVAKDPEKFLHEKVGFSELLDVVSEKDLKRDANLTLLKAVRHLIQQQETKRPRIGNRTLERLNEIFIDLSAERNPQRLLATILAKSMQLTRADGGTLYMVNEKDGEMYFKLKISSDHIYQINVQPVSTKVVENSICGYVALTNKLVNLPDIGELKPLMLPQFHKQMDHSHRDRTISVLCVPMRNSRNEIIAILQLVNKKPEGGNESPEYIPFEQDDVSILASFCTQAAVCLENVELYADIQRLFEGFVKASISAIESRDPSTGGHSERVAKLSVGLARATTECQTGIYRSVRFRDEEVRELEYAAMLHDFGKIGVREEVLVKAKKLYPYQLEAIRERVKICTAAAKISFLEKKLKSGGEDRHLEEEYKARMAAIESYWQIIQQANEPSVLKKENKELLEKIRNEQLLLPDGTSIAVVTEEEYKALSVSRGSLTESERLEVESHVRHTYQFLKMIPWTKDFKNLTEVAYCHHEKLDGSGYPRGLIAHEIPLQSKIMTIADIYDALTAADRWYKEAVPVERAIEILQYEVNEGKLDPVLFEIFKEKKIFELTQPKSLNQVA